MNIPSRLAVRTCLVALATLTFTPARAQVISDNVAGYVTVPYFAGWNLIANPLDFQPVNTLTNIFRNDLPDQSRLVTYNAGTPSTYTFLSGQGWFDRNLTLAPSVTLNPGQGAALFLNIGPTNFTWVGNVVGFDFDHNVRLPVSTPTNGVYLLSTLAPIGTNSFADIVGRAPHNNDSVMFLDTAGTPSIYTFHSGLWFDPQGGHTAPTVEIAHSAFFDLTGDSFGSFDVAAVTPVPEPAVVWLLGLGVSALFVLRRRK